MTQREQREQAAEILTELAQMRAYYLAYAELALGRVLAAAQNAPQHGGIADGSISEAQWNSLTRIERALSDLNAAIGHALPLIGGGT